MGIGNCCSKNEYDKNSQATFVNGNIITENGEYFEKQTEKFYSKIDNKQFEPIKVHLKILLNIKVNSS